MTTAFPGPFGLDEIPQPKIFGREMVLLCNSWPLGVWWSLNFGSLRIELTRYDTADWAWNLGDHLEELVDSSTMEAAILEIERYLLLIRDTFPAAPLDPHTQQGLDAYATHLGRQAAAGLILNYETIWLEEYDRRRTHAKIPHRGAITGAAQHDEASQDT